MERFLIYSHVFSGITVLLLGLVNILMTKGTKNHVLIGRIYVGAMWWICLSSLGIILFYRFSFFLMVIAVITFYTSFVGIRVLRRRKIGEEKWYDWGASILTGIFGLGLTGYAAYLFASSNSTTLAGLSLVFGIATLASGIQDVRFFAKAKVNHRQWWLHQHINAIGGSYIAAITAFVVQNGQVLAPGWSYQWLFWVLPSAIGSPIIARTIAKYKKKTTSSVASLD